MNLMDYVLLSGLLAFCAFITYTVHEVGNAVYSYLDDYEDCI